jgi:hypothetical protein
MEDLREAIRAKLRYDAATGEFRWKVSHARAKVGMLAGYIDFYGRRCIGIQGLEFKAHRLAWLLHHGDWPDCDIDHINGDKDDNRMCNLRAVPHSVNIENVRKPFAGNTTGFLGVAPHRARFRATISVGNKQRHLGTYDTPTEAHEAYLAAKRELHAGCTI